MPFTLILAMVLVATVCVLIMGWWVRIVVQRSISNAMLRTEHLFDRAEQVRTRIADQTRKIDELEDALGHLSQNSRELLGAKQILERVEHDLTALPRWIFDLDDTERRKTPKSASEVSESH